MRNYWAIVLLKSIEIDARLNCHLQLDLYPRRYICSFLEKWLNLGEQGGEVERGQNRSL